MPANAADRRWRKLKRQVAREMGLARSAMRRIVENGDALNYPRLHAATDARWHAYWKVLGYMQKAEDSHD